MPRKNTKNVCNERIIIIKFIEGFTIAFSILQSLIIKIYISCIIIHRSQRPFI